MSLMVVEYGFYDCPKICKQKHFSPSLCKFELNFVQCLWVTLSEDSNGGTAEEVFLDPGSWEALEEVEIFLEGVTLGSF